MVVVWVETDNGRCKKSAWSAIHYAYKIDQQVTAVALGKVADEDAKTAGKYGASKFIQVDTADVENTNAQMQAVLDAVAETKATLVVFAHTLNGTLAAGKVAAALSASLATNVVELPDTSSGFVVKKSIYTGKAFVRVAMKSAVKVLTIHKNAMEPAEVNVQVEVVNKTFSTSPAQPVKSIAKEKTSGELLLTDAAIVVSGGRGMKGAEHWGMLLDLAKTLHAATGCSKPVSDIGWRPHHEHVGQTGIKVAPQLYIAIGISGAIQHLAGVNSSKCILVINKDPEAPFFKAADYGVVGDAFEIVPKLTEAFRKVLGS